MGHVCGFWLGVNSGMGKEWDSLECVIICFGRRKNLKHLEKRYENLVTLDFCIFLGFPIVDRSRMVK
jgi:hypothetical protein